MDVLFLFGLSVTSLLALLLASPFLRHRLLGVGWLALTLLGWLTLSSLIDLRATTLGLLVSYYSLSVLVGVLYMIQPQSRVLYWTRLAHGMVAGLFLGHGHGVLLATLVAFAISGWIVLWEKRRQTT